MRMQKAYALLLGMVGVAATTDCSSESTGTGNNDKGPTDITVTWTFSGKPASAEECMARGGTKVYLNLSGTIDPSLHRTVNEECAKGTVQLPGLDVDRLGTPYLEGALVNDKETTVTRQGQIVMPMSGATSVTLDFFPIIVDGGQGGASGSSSSSKAASSGASSSAASSSAASSSASGGSGDAGADGG